jgi:hypothetical protein
MALSRVVQRSSSARGVQRPHVDGQLGRSIAAAGTKNIGSPAFELRFPRVPSGGNEFELW